MYDTGPKNIIIFKVLGKANGAPPVILVLVGSIPTPKFFSHFIKNFEGGQWALLYELQLPSRRLYTMLKKRDLNECHELFDLMSHPDVFPFVRHKTTVYEEFLFITKQVIEAEERGELISRTILDEWGSPIGTISLYDIQENAGFLGTWLGKPYHGKGYNKQAKDAFFQEIFYELGIETVFMRIRSENIRSQKAAEKLPYLIDASESRKSLMEQLNSNGNQFKLFEIPKDLYTLHTLRIGNQTEEATQPLEA
jgi:RimJ/RimL family protein N-acetyltransferase